MSARRTRCAVSAVAVAIAMIATGCSAPTDDVAASPKATWPSGRTAAPPVGGARPVVVDTDLGGDDLLALAHLLSRSDVDVLAVTVVGTGLVHCAAGVPLAGALVATIAARPIPVACGREVADGGRAMPDAWRAVADRGSGLPAPTDAGSVDPRPAAEVIAAAIDASDDPVTVLALGPMTNVADALRLRPDLAGSGAAVHAMGGALTAPGNAGTASDTEGVAEWNVLADPVSADAVVRSGIPLTLVPLDATDGVRFDVDAVVAAAGSSDGAAAALVDALLAANPDLAALPWWDVLASVAWLEPGVVAEQADRPLAIRTDGAELGRTVEETGGAPVRVVSRLDAARASAVYLSGL